MVDRLLSTFLNTTDVSHEFGAPFSRIATSVYQSIQFYVVEDSTGNTVHRDNLQNPESRSFFRKTPSLIPGKEQKYECSIIKYLDTCWVNYVTEL